MSSTTRRVRMDTVAIFSCELSEWRENYRNKMKIEFWTFQDPEKHYIIGSAQLHMYNFIHHIHGIESHYIWGDGVLRGKMIYEYAFSYGAFGFGHSTQFRNTDVPLFQAVSHSLFPRIRLDDDDVMEERFNTILPSRLKMMSRNSFVQERSTDPRNKSGEETVPKSVTLHQVEFEDGYPVHCKVFMPIYQQELEADFSDAYGDYLCLAKRSERIDFCRKLIDGRRVDVREAVYATPLFQTLSQMDVEDVLTKCDDISAMAYPANKDCSHGHKTVVYADDEKLLELLPSTDRSSGYLGRLFGFGGEHEEGDQRPDFPLEDLQFLKRKHKPGISISLWTRYLWSRFGACLSWLRHSIIPVNLKHRNQVPEISVTLPSPQVSTTNLHVIWVEPDPPKSVLNEDQVFREEAQRFGLPPDDDDSFENVKNDGGGDKADNEKTDQKKTSKFSPVKEKGTSQEDDLKKRK